MLPEQVREHTQSVHTEKTDCRFMTELKWIFITLVECIRTFWLHFLFDASKWKWSGLTRRFLQWKLSLFDATILGIIITFNENKFGCFWSCRSHAASVVFPASRRLNVYISWIPSIAPWFRVFIKTLLLRSNSPYIFPHETKKNTHSMCIAWACIRLPHTIVAAARIAWDCPRLNMRRSINSRTVMSFRMNENVLATSTHTLHTQREGETDKSSHRCGQHHHHRRRRFLQNPCRLHRPTDHIETNVTFFIWWRHNGIVSTNGQHLWLWLCEYCSGDWHSCFLAAPPFLVS